MSPPNLAAENPSDAGSRCERKRPASFCSRCSKARRDHSVPRVPMGTVSRNEMTCMPSREASFLPTNEACDERTGALLVLLRRRVRRCCVVQSKPTAASVLSAAFEGFERSSFLKPTDRPSKSQKSKL